MFELLAAKDGYAAACDVDSFLHTCLFPDDCARDYAIRVEAFLYDLPQTIFENAYRQWGHYVAFSGYLSLYRSSKVLWTGLERV